MSGIGAVSGDSMRERRRAFRYQYDHLRTGLLGEPRGHKGMYGAVLIDPCDPEADIGVLYMHNSGYMDMCGHATIGVATALIEIGVIEAQEPITRVALDTPAGLVVARVSVEHGRARGVTFRNVPAWVGVVGASLDVPDYGELLVDVAFGGNTFVWAWAEHMGVVVGPSNLRAAVDAGMALMQAANEQLVIRHPLTGERVEIDIATILDTPAADPPAVRNVHVFGSRLFDRSPGGTGASARLAVMYHRGEVGMGEEVAIEGAITNGIFLGRVVDETEVGERTAAITEITGTAHVTGMHEFIFDAEDRLSKGFLIEEA